jgi:hypothetical protein
MIEGTTSKRHHVEEATKIPKKRIAISIEGGLKARQHHKFGLRFSLPTME